MCPFFKNNFTFQNGFMPGDLGKLWKVLISQEFCTESALSSWEHFRQVMCLPSGSLLSSFTLGINDAVFKHCYRFLPSILDIRTMEYVNILILRVPLACHMIISTNLVSFKPQQRTYCLSTKSTQGKTSQREYKRSQLRNTH